MAKQEFHIRKAIHVKPLESNIEHPMPRHRAAPSATGCISSSLMETEPCLTRHVKNVLGSLAHCVRPKFYISCCRKSGVSFSCFYVRRICLLLCFMIRLQACLHMTLHTATQKPACRSVELPCPKVDTWTYEEKVLHLSEPFLSVFSPSLSLSLTHSCSLSLFLRPCFVRFPACGVNRSRAASTRHPGTAYIGFSALENQTPTRKPSKANFLECTFQAIFACPAPT